MGFTMGARGKFRVSTALIPSEIFLSKLRVCQVEHDGILTDPQCNTGVTPVNYIQIYMERYSIVILLRINI